MPVGSSFYCTCPSNCYGYDCSYCPYGTSTPSSSTCTDYNASVCAKYAALGYCNLNAYLNGTLFKVSCPVSCNNCNSSVSTTTQSSSSNCTDFNSYLCQYYAGLGYCSYSNAYFIGSLFKTSCPVSCNTCSTTTSSPSTCVDQQANCVYWANYCNLIPSPNPCPKTCKLC